ncbi:MAG: hypothetical protein HDQ95_04070 [Roseburia sp.]|nr:hypothetical protein [Roseburia sp.]
MVKLREPFSQKIHLHIKQDMLLKLWDKYVPVESSEYEKIQLIYLDGGAGQTSGQSQQIQLLISLVLKNRIMRMGLEGYPVKTALVREQMGNSLQRMEKYYLMQLKCCDFATFRKVSRYAEMLTQAETDVRRYRNWQKDHQAIEKQRDRYRLFSLFSSDIKEFLTEHSVQAMRTVEKEMLSALSEKEYRQLAESVIWQEKERFLSFLENCNEVQCRKIIKRLEETGIRMNIKQLEERPEGKAFAKAADQLGQKEFYLFFRQAVRIEGADGQFVIWKGKKEKMLSYIEKQESETVRQLWIQMENSSVFSEKLVQLGEQYFREVIKDFRERVTSVLSTEKFKEIADMADFLWEELERESADGSRITSETEIWQMTERIESELKLHRERIEQREAQSYLKYRNEYREILGEDGFEIQKLISYIHELKEEKREEFIENLTDMIHVWQKVNMSKQPPLQASVTEEDGIDLPAQTDLLRLTEEIFRSEHEEKLTEEELQNIYEWGRTVIENFSETESSKIQKLLSHIQELKEETAEIPYHELWEWGKALLFYTEHGQERTDADLLPGYQENLQISDSVRNANRVRKEELSSDIIHRQIEVAKDRNSLQRLVTQINHRVDSGQEPLEQKFRLEYADSQLNIPQVQSLLCYIRKLDEEQYGILIKELSQVTKIQWMQHIGQEIHKADAIVTEQTQGERIDIEQRWDSRQLAAAYPKLVTHIREFEEQRHKRIREEITTLENNVLFQDQMIYLEQGVSYDSRKAGRLPQPAYRESMENGIGLESVWENSIDLENIWENRNREWKLQYSVQNAQISGEEQQRDKMRMQEETNQLRSAQQQIDKKLQEVEVQLKKLESTAKAKEDVRDLADKVKRQLYEELHVEKLRRGLI